LYFVQLEGTGFMPFIAYRLKKVVGVFVRFHCAASSGAEHTHTFTHSHTNLTHLVLTNSRPALCPTGVCVS
jgi:hypothetical protein